MRTLVKLMAAMFIAGITVALLASPAMADEDLIYVEVRAISATPDGDYFDPELEEMRGRLERGFTDYHSFRQLDRTRRRIERGDSRDFELPTGDILTLSYKGPADEYVKLGLAIGSRLNTTLRATPGSTFFQAGLTFEGGLLILAITVRDR